MSDYSTLVDHLFRLSWPSIPTDLINYYFSLNSDGVDQTFRWPWPSKNPDCKISVRTYFYLLLIDLSPLIFIVCDFDTILSNIASANAPPPSLLCHPATSNWEHRIVECTRYLFSNTSRISCCSMLFVVTNSHSSNIKRSHLSYCLILFL